MIEKYLETKIAKCDRPERKNLVFATLSAPECWFKTSTEEKKEVIVPHRKDQNYISVIYSILEMLEKKQNRCKCQVLKDILKEKKNYKRFL